MIPSGIDGIVSVAATGADVFAASMMGVTFGGVYGLKRYAFCMCDNVPFDGLARSDSCCEHCYSRIKGPHSSNLLLHSDLPRTCQHLRSLFNHELVG